MTWDKDSWPVIRRVQQCGKGSMDMTLLSNQSVVGSLLLQGFLAVAQRQFMLAKFHSLPYYYLGCGYHGQETMAKTI